MSDPKGSPKEAPGLDDREEWWKRQAAAHQSSQSVRLTGEKSREGIVGALGKVLAGSGFDLRASTKAVREQFEKQCRLADEEWSKGKGTDGGGKP